MLKLALALVLSSLLFSQSALASLLLAGSLGSGSFSFRPQDSEPTPNYLGFTPGMQFGLSIQQHFDVVLFAQQTFAGYEKFANPNNATLGLAGLRLGGRLKTISFGAQGGWAQYHLLKTTDASSEFDGQWQGIGAGLYLGGLLPLWKKHTLEVAFAYNVLTVKSHTQSQTGTRTIDQIMITLTYTFNEILGKLMGNNLFQSLN